MPGKRMKAVATIAVVSGAVLTLCVSSSDIQAVPPANSATGTNSVSAVSTIAEPSETQAEARARAELLHETFHAALQVVHHEYYREDEGLTIPALTLKKVFRELAARKNVELRWLVVDAAPMNTDHLPKNEFERKAVVALAAGKESFESSDGGVYRYAAPITLGSECLKCHLPNRKSTESRTAGLLIGIPLTVTR